MIRPVRTDSCTSVDREIRATPQPTRRDFQPFFWVYVAAISKRLARVRYVCLSDLLEDVKCDLARAKVPYDSVAIGDAVRWLWLKRRGLLSVKQPALNIEVEAEGARPLSRLEAADVVRRIGGHVRSFGEGR